MARLSLDNFPKSSFKLTDGQKIMLVVLTVGFILLIGHLIAEGKKARKIAQAKMAATQEKLKAAELERAAVQIVVTKAFGQETTDIFNEATNTVIEEIKNQPKTGDGATPQ